MSPPRSYDDIPLQAENTLDAPIQIHIQLQDAMGAANLSERRVQLGPHERRILEPFTVGHGDYTLAAQAGTRTRATHLALGEGSPTYRFVVLADAIALRVGPP